MVSWRPARTVVASQTVRAVRLRVTTVWTAAANHIVWANDAAVTGDASSSVTIAAVLVAIVPNAKSAPCWDVRHAKKTKLVASTSRV